jgi:hypothetical protein
MTTCFLSHMPKRGVIVEKSEINTHGMWGTWGAIAKKHVPENSSNSDLFRKPRMYCTVMSAM